MKKNLTTVLVLAGLVTGCETPGSLPQKHTATDYPGYILNLAAGGTNSIAPKPALQIRLAVAQIGEPAPLKTMLASLAADPHLVASVIGLPLPGASENRTGTGVEKSPAANYAREVKAVCNLAQAGGADYVLIYGDSVETWVKQNALSMFDCTLVGAEIIPGGKINLQGRAAAALIEAPSGRPVFLLNADCRRTAPTPNFLANGKAAEMRVTASDQLAGELSAALLRKLADTATGPK